MDRIDSMLERVSPPPARTKQSATPSRTVYIARSQPSPTVGSPPAAKVRYVCVSEATTQMHMHAHAITRRLPHPSANSDMRAHGHTGTCIRTGNLTRIPKRARLPALRIAVHWIQPVGH